MFDKITVIGCGLIGSSILRVIEKKNIAKEINAYDKSKEVTSYLAKNFKFKICDNITEAVNNADLVIISSPLSSYKEILSQIQSNLKKGSILTDTGSAKKEINKIIKETNMKLPEVVSRDSNHNTHNKPPIPGPIARQNDAIV